MVIHWLHFSGAAALKVRSVSPLSFLLAAPSFLLPSSTFTLDHQQGSSQSPWSCSRFLPATLACSGSVRHQRHRDRAGRRDKVSSESCDQDRLTPGRNRRSSGSVHGSTRVCSIKQDFNSFQIHFLDFVFLVRGIYSRQIEASLSHERL